MAAVVSGSVLFAFTAPASAPSAAAMRSVRSFFRALSSAANSASPRGKSLRREPRHAERAPARGLLVRFIERREIHRVGCRFEFRPQLELRERFQQALPSEFVALPGLRPEARQLDHVFREIDRIVHAADVAEVFDEPVVVVREVVDLIRQHPRRDHVGVIDARRGLLLPRGIGVAMRDWRRCAPACATCGRCPAPLVRRAAAEGSACWSLFGPFQRWMR